MSRDKHKTLRLGVLRLSYILAIFLLFYLLFVSRADEVHTVWEALNPTFIPTFIVATFFLCAIIFSREKVEYKLFFTIIHSVLSHVFIVVIFPSGNLGVQQTMLGNTRLVFDNVISNGFGWTEASIPLKIYILGRGENFQTAFSVIFARMFGVDVYWTHLLLVPLLWGIFVPPLTFLASKALRASETVCVLSGLLISVFPTSIVWGKESIPNSLSSLFFFCFVYFMLKYFNSNRVKNLSLVILFFLATFLSHYLAGTVAFSLLLLSSSIKTYQTEKAKSNLRAKLMLLISFLFCVTILPFALAYRRFFYPWANTSFSLRTFYELPSLSTFLYILLGNYFDLISREAYITTLIFGVAPLVGLIGMVYILVTSVRRGSKSIDLSVSFLFLGVALIEINDRILKLFMINVPFAEADRLWMLRDFLLVAFAAFFIVGSIQEMSVVLAKAYDKFLFSLRKASLSLRLYKLAFPAKLSSFASASVHALIIILISGWVTASVYYAYPHLAPLQTTSYEIEAVKNIDETTNQRYIVVADQWLIFAGQMFVGIYNPRAFYFSHVDPHGVSLFIKMKTNPTNETLLSAMETNNATVAYFIIEKPRLGTETYNDIINQAQQNNLQTYKIFYYPEGEEKLRIFYCKKIAG